MVKPWMQLMMVLRLELYGPSDNRHVSTLGLCTLAGGVCSSSNRRRRSRSKQNKTRVFVLVEWVGGVKNTHREEMKRLKWMEEELKSIIIYRSLDYVDCVSYSTRECVIICSREILIYRYTYIVIQFNPSVPAFA